MRELRERTADVQAVLGRQMTQARQILRKLLDGKIAVEPVTVDGVEVWPGRLNGRLLRADVLRVIEAGTRAEEVTVRRWWPRGIDRTCRIKCVITARR